MRRLWPLLLMTACTIPAGEHHQVRGVVQEVGGSTLVLEQEGARTSFVVDPNLSRRVKVGDEILANVLVGEEGAPSRVIGVEPAR